MIAGNAALFETEPYSTGVQPAPPKSQILPSIPAETQQNETPGTAFAPSEGLPGFLTSGES